MRTNRATNATGVSTPRNPGAPETTDAPSALLGGALLGDASAGLPWCAVFASAEPEDASVGGCRTTPLGPAVLVDMDGAQLRLRDHPAAVAAGVVLIQAVVDGVFAEEAADRPHGLIRPGQVVVRTASHAYFASADGQARMITLAAPRFLLTPRFAVSGALKRGGVFSGCLASRLLHGFLVGLADGEGSPGGAFDAVIDTGGALAGLCLAQQPPTPISLAGLTEYRTDLILRYLARNFANTKLTPTVMAEDLGISVRYAHKLLEQTGRSFRRELIALRLRAARQAFVARVTPRQSIADIAISVGFNDLSQFNRHFREAYDMTPRAARRQDEAEAGPPPAPRPGRKVPPTEISSRASGRRR